MFNKRNITFIKSNGALDVADGTTILDDVSAISPVIQTALTNIVAKKPAFTSERHLRPPTKLYSRDLKQHLALNGEVGGILALVLQDLEDLNSNTTAFANALIADAPVSFNFNYFRLHRC